MSSLPERASDELGAFAAAVAHELRTPLAALSGEVDIALRRPRTAADYREALVRVAAAVVELVELTDDLALLGQNDDAEPPPAKTARLDGLLAPVVARYAPASGVAVDVVPAGIVVEGDEALLTRAITLVVEHAVRHRRGGARIGLRGASPEDPSSAVSRIEVIVDAEPGAFWPQAWECLAATPRIGDSAAGLARGPLRLRTADRIIRRFGGSLDAASADGSGGIRIRLRRAEPV